MPQSIRTAWPEGWLQPRFGLRDRLASSAPVVDPNLWGADGTVLSIARSGNTLYIAGAFRSVGENSGGCVPFDARTGEPLKGFPKVAGSVYAIVPDRSGGWYLGGEFAAVGGLPRSCLAHVLADGSVADWNPSVTGSPAYIDPPAVVALAVRGDRIYVGGGFRAIGGMPRENIGCVDASTGSVLDWNPGTHVGGYVSALAIHENTVFAGGWFTSIGGQPRPYLAAVGAATGAVTPWQADAIGAVRALLVREHTLYVGGAFLGIGGKVRPLLAAIDVNTAAVLPFNSNASGIVLDFLPDPAVTALAIVGDTLYAAGNFTQIGGQSRASIAALNATTGAATGWNPPIIGPQYPGFPPRTCSAIVVQGGTIYLGGFFETLAGQSRPFVASLSATTGAVTNWNPKPNDAVYCLGVNSNTVYVGGGFGMVGEWEHRAGIAAIDITTGAVKPWNPNPDGSVVTAVAADQGRVFVSGDFASIGGQARNYFAALDTINGEATGWNPGSNGVADALLIDGETIYAGGYFTQVGGQLRNYLAAASAATGEVTAWNPDASWPVLAMARSGSTIYVGGLFDLIGGEWRRGIAAVDATTGAPTAWNPDTDNSVVDALVVSGNTIYVGGGFQQISGQPRVALAALGTATGEATPWYPQPTAWGSPTRIRALALVGATLYVGGDFGGIGGQPRICLAAVDTSTGLATDWDPGTDGLVWTLSVYGNTVYAGGGFTRAGGLPATGLAAFSIPEEPAPAPVSFDLAQSIPNPASSSAMIRFSLPQAGTVTLSVYDVQGRCVAMPLDHVVQPAGRHDVPVQADLWKPGVYFYRLEAGGRSATRKMLVVK